MSPYPVTEATQQILNTGGHPRPEVNIRVVGLLPDEVLMHVMRDEVDQDKKLLDLAEAVRAMRRYELGLRFDAPIASSMIISWVARLSEAITIEASYRMGVITPVDPSSKDAARVSIFAPEDRIPAHWKPTEKGLEVLRRAQANGSIAPAAEANKPAQGTT